MRKKLLALIGAITSAAIGIAYAQGYLNPPVYATGMIWVQPGGTVTTTVRQAVNPNNMNVFASGAITNWTVRMPFPAFDGQIVSVGCPGGNVTALTIAAQGTDTIQLGYPTACLTSNNAMYQYQYYADKASWFFVANLTTTPNLNPSFSSITVPGQTGYAYANNASPMTFSTTVPVTSVTNAIPSVATTAALQALATTYASSISKYGYYVANDSPTVVYKSSGSACSLSAGAGDGGSQIPSADGKCWIANLSGTASVATWGAKGDGTTNNTAVLQKAITYLGSNGGYLSLEGSTYGTTYLINSALTWTMTAKGNTGIRGPGTLKIATNLAGDALTAINNVGRIAVPEISGVTFDIANNTVSTSAITLKQIQNMLIENNVFITDHAGVWNANFGAIDLKSLTPGNGDTNSFWNTIRKNVFTPLSGPATYLPMAVKLEGQTNATLILDNSFINCLNCVALLQEQANGLSNVDSGNDIKIAYNKFEGFTTAIQQKPAGAPGYLPSGVLITGNRAEGGTNFFYMTSSGGTPNDSGNPTILRDNFIVSSVTNYVVNPLGNNYTSIEPFSYAPYTGANTVMIGSGNLQYRIGGNFQVNNITNACGATDGHLMLGTVAAGQYHIFCNGSLGVLMLKNGGAPASVSDGYAPSGLGIFQVATLPSAATYGTGNWAIVTDCLGACAAYAAPVGGGAQMRKVMSYGGGWVIN